MATVYKIRTITPGSHYQIHEIVDGRHEGGADVRGTARDASARARSIGGKGARIVWDKPKRRA